VVEEVRGELRARRIPLRQGDAHRIMIRDPRRGDRADLLAREVEFFSIGTNDLIQYSLAIDRVNEQCLHISTSRFNPAILRLIRRVVRGRTRRRIPVSMCGEMAGEPFYSYALLGLGLDELSMNARGDPAGERILRKSGWRSEAEEFTGSLLLATRPRPRSAAPFEKRWRTCSPDERF